MNRSKRTCFRRRFRSTWTAARQQSCPRTRLWAHLGVRLNHRPHAFGLKRIHVGRSRDTHRHVCTMSGRKTQRWSILIITKSSTKIYRLSSCLSNAEKEEMDVIRLQLYSLIREPRWQPARAARSWPRSNRWSHRQFTSTTPAVTSRSSLRQAHTLTRHRSGPRQHHHSEWSHWSPEDSGWKVRCKGPRRTPNLRLWAIGLIRVLPRRTE